MKLAFLLATALAAPSLARAQSPIEAPAGWAVQLKANGARTFTPPDLEAGENYSVTIYAPAALKEKSPGKYLRAFAGPVGAAIGRLASPLEIQIKEGVVSGIGFYVGPGGSRLGVVYLGVVRDGGASLALSRTLFSQTELLPRYQQENMALNKALWARKKRSPDSSQETVSAASVPTAPGPMQPASLGEAKVFVKYYWTNYPTLSLEIGHLLLFPGGTAFDDIPSKPLASWSEAAIRQAVHPNRVGKWKAAGDKVTLSFARPQDGRILSRDPRGWADPSGMRMNDSPNTDIYFPVSAPPRARLLGAWRNEALGSAGTVGGAAPLVSGGSQSDLVLSGDGTWSGGKNSFFTSTTSNMGDASRPEADVSTSGQTRSQASGRWRLDGPLLTLEKDGARTVQLAFLLPHWGKGAADADLMIGNRRWQRPKK